MTCGTKSGDSMMTLRNGDKCRKCGRCCYFMTVIDGQLVRTNVPCPYLDAETHLCTIFKDRFWVNPRCLTLSQAIAQRVLPADCPYVADLDWYKPPMEWEEHENGRKNG